MQEVKLRVDGMKCDGCVAAVRSALEGVEGVDEADVSLTDGAATVRLAPDVDRESLVEAIAAAGYRAT